MTSPVDVEILGQKFSVTSDDGADHLRHVAAYVDEKMRAIGGPERSISPYTRAVLVALNIASECQKLREAHDEVDRVVGRITELLDEAPPTTDGEEISGRA